MGIKIKYPNFIVEFESEVRRIRSFDDYGYLEDAEIVKKMV